MESNKKASSKKVFKVFNKGVELSLALGLIIVIIALFVIFLLNRANLKNDSNMNNINSYPLPFISPNQNEVIQINDDKNIRVSNINISLEGNWRVITALKNYANNTDFRCESGNQNECTAYYVTNGETTFYVSTPSALRTTVGTVTTNEEKIVSINGNDYKFNYAKIKLVNRVENSDEVIEDTSKTIYKEAYGCIADSICISSGYLNIEDEAENKKEIEAFEGFLKSLKII